MGAPAARFLDPASHDGVVPSGLVGPAATGPCGKPTVLIEGRAAAHAGCSVVCTGLTGAGPAHPPLPPTGAGGEGGGAGGAASGGGDDGGEEEGGGAEGRDPGVAADGTREIRIRVVGGLGGAVTVPGVELTGKKDVIVFEIWDVGRGEKAMFLWSSNGPISGLGVSLGPTFTGEVKVGGDWNSVRVPRGVDLNRMHGMKFVTWSLAQNPVQSVGRSDAWVTVVDPGEGGIFDGRLRDVAIEDFEFGDAFNFYTAAEYSVSDGSFTRIPFSTSEVELEGAVAAGGPAMSPIIAGSAKVFIHGMPAARWGDAAACGVVIGNPALAATRTVLVG